MFLEKEKYLASENFCLLMMFLHFLYVFFLKAKTISTPFTWKPDFLSGCVPGKTLKPEKWICNPPSSPFLWSTQLFPYHLILRWPSAGAGFWTSSWLDARLSLHSRSPMHLAGLGTLESCNKNFGTFTFTLGVEHPSDANPVYSEMPLHLETSSNTAHKLHTKNPGLLNFQTCQQKVTKGFSSSKVFS